MKLRKFFSELKRRKVYQVALTYGLTAWLLAQVLDLATDAFNAPDWFMQMSLVILLIGFPVALILAWAFELSPKGIVRTDSEQSEDNPYSPSERRPMINYVVIAMLIAVIGYLLLSRSNAVDTPPSRAKAGVATPNSIPIAMLTLHNLSEDPNLGHFANGVTQDIINELGKIRSFSVTAFSAVYGGQYANKETKTVAEELGVDYLISGSARAFASGDSILINVELLDPYSGRRIWNAIFQELMDEAPSIQSAIARKVAASLNVQLSDEENESLSSGRTKSGPAYMKFMEARNEFKYLQPNQMGHAISLLEEAIALDPNYVEAHTLLAWIMVFHGWPNAKRDQATLESFRIRINKHLAIADRLDPTSSDIRLVKANFAVTYLDDLKMAANLVDEALELNSWPDQPTSLCICTAVTTNVIKGNLSRARGIAGVANRVEPGNILLLNDQFFMNLVEGDLDSAAVNMEEAKRRMDVPLFRAQLGWTYYLQKRYQKAKEVLTSAYDGQGFIPTRVMALLSNTYYELGDIERSNAYKDSLETMLSEGETYVLVDLATIAAGRGEDDLTLSLLERHQNEAVTSLAYIVNVDPIFRKYDSDPRFVEIRQKMKYYD